MSLADNNPEFPPEQGSDRQAPSAQTEPSPSSEPSAPLAGDPISYVIVHPEAAHPAMSNLPEDLRISWSWPHLLLFLVYAMVGQILIGIGALAYYSTSRHMTRRQIRHLLECERRLIVGTNVRSAARIMLCLCVAL